jgi:hypothetical protein
MPKVFPEEEKQAVRKLSREGLTNTAIAAKMQELYPENWTTKHGDRAVARILAEDPVSLTTSENKTLDEMTREERYKHIQSKLSSTPRFRLTFNKFKDEEKEVFVDEYLNIVRATDTITEVEEQGLFAAILELILALQALGRKEQEEDYYERSMNNEIPSTDPKYRTFVNEKYQKEYDQHMKLYQNGIKGLKMSREQRLKEVRTERRTLVDLAEELSHRTTQAQVATEIERLNKLSDEELKKLLEAGHVLGEFGTQ